MPCGHLMFDKPTLILAVKYATLFIATMALLSFGILFYMSQFTGGDYLNDMRLDGTTQISRDDATIAIANKAADSVQDRLEKGLLLLNGLFIILIPIVSYRLARSALRPIQQSLEQQQQFVDNASHEFKTPLAVMSGELQLALAKRRTGAEYIAAIQVSLNEIKHLSALTRSLLLLARGHNNAIASDFKVVNIAAVIAAARQSVEGAAKTKEITITGGESPKLELRGSMPLLQQMLVNIFENAIKYSPDHTTVSVQARREHDKIIISVLDQGPGLSQVQRRQAAKRFWRSDAARHTAGDGLGLAIVEEIVRLHDGTLRLESVPETPGLGVIMSFPMHK